MRGSGAQGQPITAIQSARTEAGLSLKDAKRLYEHLTIHDGECRNCRARIKSPYLGVLCDHCGTLNFDG